MKATISLLFSCLVCLAASLEKTRPNIVFFLVDDQDVMLNSLDAMQKTREIFTDNGLKFYNGFSSTPVCCVSRSSMLLGRYVHNHLAMNNTVAGGCYSDEWVATEEEYAYNNYLNKAGYTTYYSGKYLNNYGKGSTGSGRTYETVPAGWDSWYTLVGDAKFYSYTLSNNGEEEEHGEDYESDYFPLMQKNHALSFLDEMSKEEANGKEENPFLMVMATPAAHKPWTPAPEYAYIVDDESMIAPRTPNWNFMQNSDKGVVLQSLDEMDDDLVSQSDEIYRRRHAILLSVDDMIAEVYDKLDSMGKLDNTYFIYTADHGFHVGQYGMTFGKRLLYDTDIRVPFYVSGPSVKKNGVTSAMALNVDIAPTIIELALGKEAIPSDMDGRSLVEFFDLSDDEEYELSTQKQAFIVEYNGESPPSDPTESWRLFSGQNDEPGRIMPGEQQRRKLLSSPQNEWIMNCESQVQGLDGMNCDSWNNTYKCVRVIDGLKEQYEQSLTSSEASETTWESNMDSYLKGEMYCTYTCFDENYMEAECMDDSVEKMGEYYDLDYDTWQTSNRMASLEEGAKSEYESILSMFKSCSGESCRELRSSVSTWYKRGSKRSKNAMLSEETSETVTRHMSNASYIVIGTVLLIGMALLWALYNHIMKKLTEQEPKYSKLPTRTNYGTNPSEPTQAL